MYSAFTPNITSEAFTHIQQLMGRINTAHVQSDTKITHRSFYVPLLRQQHKSRFTNVLIDCHHKQHTALLSTFRLSKTKSINIVKLSCNIIHVQYALLATWVGTYCADNETKQFSFAATLYVHCVRTQTCDFFIKLQCAFCINIVCTVDCANGQMVSPKQHTTINAFNGPSHDNLDNHS